MKEQYVERKHRAHICLFAGTTEGHALARFLGNQNVTVTICVVTEYGAELIEPYDNERILQGKLPVEEIIRLLSEEDYDLLIDATHPYAQSITGSLMSACSQCDVEYLRLLRKASDLPEDALLAADAKEAVAILNETTGNILFTTGSKDLGIYKEISGFSERAYARVLPLAGSLESCASAGLSASHIIAMQGPFSLEMNRAMLEAAHAAWLVTKDGSDEGGFTAKVRAARQAGARLVVLGRPEQVQGESYNQVVQILCERFGCVNKPKVNVIGIGPGSRDLLTLRGQQAIGRSSCLIGAKRMLEMANFPNKNCIAAISPETIAEYIFCHPEFSEFSVLMSGDTGFFSGTKKLLPLLADAQVEVIPGISSQSYMCSKLQIPYDDLYATSLHGRSGDIVAEVRKHHRVFVLTGGENGAAQVCAQLTAGGLGDAQVFIGQQLSYSQEKIFSGSARQLALGEYDPLCAMVIENAISSSAEETLQDCCQEQAQDGDLHANYIPGLDDALFQRSEIREKIVPMTKSEVRAIILSKLRPYRDAVCWDIGAGTGSVSVELALQAAQGQVYAIEKRSDAVTLLKENKQKFGVKNLTIISGNAPEVLQGLAAPTHVFIGGSTGNMREILLAVLEKNREARIVATAVSLEAISQLTACTKELGLQSQVIAVNIARSREAGQYHLMSAQNPVYIFVLA